MAALNEIPGSILSDVIAWVRRIVKTSSGQALTDQTIGDYINRFYVYDMPARIQQFELKRQYTFETVPNQFQYQLPRAKDSNGNELEYFQYQLIKDPMYCDGVQMGLYFSNDQFYKIYPEFVNNQILAQGDGTTSVEAQTLSRFPILNGVVDDFGHLTPYVFITALDSSNQQMYVVDDGNGNLIQTDSSFQYAPDGISDPIVTGTVDYVNGEISDFDFTSAVPNGNNIEFQTSPYSAGRPRICLFFNNIFKLYPVPDRAYKIQCDAYITPAQFLDTEDAVRFAYMAEYIARGAARKILSDVGDLDQFQFYEQFFKEQENLVLRRTSRQNALMRTPTIFSSVNSQNSYQYTQY